MPSKKLTAAGAAAMTAAATAEIRKLALPRWAQWWLPPREETTHTAITGTVRRPRARPHSRSAAGPRRAASTGIALRALRPLDQACPTDENPLPSSSVREAVGVGDGRCDAGEGPRSGAGWAPHAADAAVVVRRGRCVARRGTDGRRG